MSEPPEVAHAPGRVEWLELFFDLVVVAAVAVLSETLREDATSRELGLFLISYAAVWFAWVSVVMYADVAGELTRVRTVVVSMFLVAVMAASAPGHFDTRADAFAGAFVLVRVFAARGSLRTGRLMTGWPLLQAGGFTLPWLVSLAVPTPWKYGLWALGLALDLVAVLARSEGLRDDDRKRLEERLGLFVIIVLGESVAALVLTAARTPWTRDFVATSVAGFLLLVLLWLLTFSYGFSSAPGVRPGSMPPRFGLPLHLASTLGILLIGVGLGAAVAELAGARRPVAGRPVRRGHRDPAVGAAHVGRGPRPGRRVGAPVVLRPRRPELGDPASPSQAAGRRDPGRLTVGMNPAGARDVGS